jgi:glycosyltransferase involved in cell wall biosynthesis
MSGANSHFLSIVVPVYNEEDSLRPLHQEISEAFRKVPGTSYEIILVDDGSHDASFDVIRELHAADPEHVRGIRLRRNFGQTAAMAAGFDAASGDLIIPLDADLQNDPNDIPRLVAVIDEGYDVVSGWRADRQDKFLSRRLPSIAANTLISRITGVRLHDYGCTLKIYKRDVIEHMRLYGELHRFLPALASWAGASVTEAKVNHRARRYGRSKYGIGRTIRVILDLITVKFLLSYSTKPMQVFGKWGFVSIFLGFISGLFTAAMKILENQSVNRNGWTFVCIFFTLGGLQLIGMGILGEINVRTYYESQKKPVYTVRERLDTKL